MDGRCAKVICFTMMVLSVFLVYIEKVCRTHSVGPLMACSPEKNWISLGQGVWGRYGTYLLFSETNSGSNVIWSGWPLVWQNGMKMLTNRPFRVSRVKLWGWSLRDSSWRNWVSYPCPELCGFSVFGNFLSLRFWRRLIHLIFVDLFAFDLARLQRNDQTQITMIWSQWA